MIHSRSSCKLTMGKAAIPLFAEGDTQSISGKVF